ncbi:MAG: response regulator transcription factor [Chloroflexi bacterium]|nr:response regulator transcription factor [Chloroflexota bacterium]
MKSAIRVLLADDHGVVRRGIREFLEEESDIQVVAEAENGLQAVELTREHQPDVVVLDIQMPGCNGIEAAQKIRLVIGQAVGILILTAYDDDPYVLAALEAGANGYVMKSADADDIVQAVRDVNEGKRVLDPSIARLVGIIQAETGPTDLTERELGVLAWTARGLTNKAIAYQLKISPRTVQGHLASIYAKLEVGTRTEAVTKAVQLGLISIPSHDV